MSQSGSSSSGVSGSGSTSTGALTELASGIASATCAVPGPYMASGGTISVASPSGPVVASAIVFRGGTVRGVAHCKATGTPAARMPQVPAARRKARAARLRAAGEAALRRFLEGRVGSTADVLVETDGFGRSEHYAPVALDGGAAGKVLAARILRSESGRLIGEVRR